ncbi:hypothetical protein [uncultured Gardnerella sp.]|uniref:hypothetical protein n=1 Tax=uncultured Gardnerella sp. TaxID=293424 RepID=UPI0034509D5B
MPILLFDAALVVSIAAPGYSFEPVITPRTPREYLFESKLGFLRYLFASFNSTNTVWREFEDSLRVAWHSFILIIVVIILSLIDVYVFAKNKRKLKIF